MGQLTAIRLPESAVRNGLADLNVRRIFFSVPLAITADGKKVDGFASVRPPMRGGLLSLPVGIGGIPTTFADTNKIAILAAAISPLLTVALPARPRVSVTLRLIARELGDDFDAEAAWAALDRRIEQGRKAGDFELFEVDHVRLSEGFAGNIC